MNEHLKNIIPDTKINIPKTKDSNVSFLEGLVFLLLMALLGLLIVILDKTVLFTP